MGGADRAPVDQPLVEAGDAAEHLLTVRVQLLQLVLDQRRVQRSALLDQVLAEHDQGVDLVGVEGDLLLEALQTGGVAIGGVATGGVRRPKQEVVNGGRAGLTLSCLILSSMSLAEKCSTLVSWRSISVSHTRIPSRVPSKSSLWEVKCCRATQNHAGLCLVMMSPDHLITNTRQSHPEAADDGGRSPLQVVPPPVPLLNHLLQPAGCVRPVLPGQPAVLLVHQLQLGQALVDLPLERL